MSKSRKVSPALVAGALALLVCAGIAIAIFSSHSSKEPNGTRPSPQPSPGIASGSALPADAAAPELPPWIRIRVGRVRVAPSNIQWDGPRDEVSMRDQCKSLAFLVGLAAGVGPGLGVACELTPGQQQQSDPTLPDLQLLLEAPNVRYASYVAFDQTEHNFEYSFVVPSQAITSEGVVLSVVDADDGSERGQEIGSTRLSKEALTDAVKSGQLLSLHPLGLSMLEVSVEAYDGAFSKQTVALNTNQGGAYVRGFEVNAGDIIRIEASGSWKISRWYSDPITTSGYTRSVLGLESLPPFAKVPHRGVGGPCRNRRGGETALDQSLRQDGVGVRWGGLGRGQ